MKIPRVPVGQFQGKEWSSTNPAGKGSWPPRNLGEGFDSNFEHINWARDDERGGEVGNWIAEIRSKAVHTRITHPQHGVKVERVRTGDSKVFEIRTEHFEGVQKITVSLVE